MEPLSFLDGVERSDERSTPWHTLLRSRADRIHDRIFFGELAGRELGPKQFTIDAQLEAATTRRYEFQVVDLLLVGRQQFRRQTDGFRFVISHRAVFQLNLHVGLLIMVPL